METWYEFRAYNGRTIYGYGTAVDALKYSAILNEGRTAYLYGARVMTAEEIAARPYLIDQGLNLNDEVAAHPSVY